MTTPGPQQNDPHDPYGRCMSVYQEAERKAWLLYKGNRTSANFAHWERHSRNLSNYMRYGTPYPSPFLRGLNA